MRFAERCAISWGGGDHWRGQRVGRTSSATAANHLGFPWLRVERTGPAAPSEVSPPARAALMRPPFPNVNKKVRIDPRQEINPWELLANLSWRAAPSGANLQPRRNTKSEPPEPLWSVGGWLLLSQVKRNAARPGPHRVLLRSRAFAGGSCRWPALAADGCVRATSCTCHRFPSA